MANPVESPAQLLSGARTSSREALERFQEEMGTPS
jgi:hypothetical protein